MYIQPWVWNYFKSKLKVPFSMLCQSLHGTNLPLTLPPRDPQLCQKVGFMTQTKSNHIPSSTSQISENWIKRLSLEKKIDCVTTEKFSNFSTLSSSQNLTQNVLN